MTTNPDTPDESEVDIKFTDFLEELDKGRVSQELGDKLLAVIEAVRKTHKAGSVTLQIKAGWDKKADMLRVGTAVSSKAPQLDRAESLFFVTKDGQPTRKDPSQLELELRNKRRQETAGNVVDFSEPRRTSNN